VSIPRPENIKTLGHITDWLATLPMTQVKGTSRAYETAWDQNPETRPVCASYVLVGATASSEAEVHQLLADRLYAYFADHEGEIVRWRRYPESGLRTPMEGWRASARVVCSRALDDAEAAAARPPEKICDGNVRIFEF
jgi:hypothetical protein